MAGLFRLAKTASLRQLAELPWFEVGSGASLSVRQGDQRTVRSHGIARLPWCVQPAVQLTAVG